MFKKKKTHTERERERGISKAEAPEETRDLCERKGERHEESRKKARRVVRVLVAKQAQKHDIDGPSSHV